MRARPFFSAPLLLVLFGLLASAASVQVLVNSQDWRDVYAGMLYGQWTGSTFNVVTNAGQGSALLDRIGTDQPILLIQSSNAPFVSGYPDLLKSRGFTVAETVVSAPGHPAGFELARRLNATRFVVLDGTYGYNAVSVIPYALRQKNWVVFSEDVAPADLSAFLSGQHAEAVMQYGTVKKTIQAPLAPLHPDVLDLGDRFSNNVALLKRMDAVAKPEQTIFSDGRFIERSMFSSFDQSGIVLVGSDAVPAVTLAYLKSAAIPVGVLIGPDLADLGRAIKKNTPTGAIFIKFAQTFIKGPGVAEPWVLDQTFLPEIPLNVSILDMQYNTQAKQLEVTYHNDVNTPTYLEAALDAFVGTSSIKSLQGTPQILLEPNATKAVAYDFDLPESAFPANGGNVSVQVTARYGAEAGALDRQVQKRQDNVAKFSFSDACALSLQNVSYDGGRQGFRVGVRNDAATACFLAPFLTYSALDRSSTLSLQRLSLDSQSGLDLFFYAPLKKEEVADLAGSTLHVHVDYGAREAFLTKSMDEDRLFALQGASIQDAPSMNWALIGGVLVAILVLFALFGRRGGSGGSAGFSARRRL